LPHYLQKNSSYRRVTADLGRWPSDADYDRLFLGVSGVVDAVEHHVVALLAEHDAAIGETEPEFAAYQDDQRRPRFTGHPFGSLVTGGMHPRFA
jgi:hypothetical protein